MRTAFPGKHLKADDLGGQTATLTISGVAMQKVGDDGEKPCVAFYETQQDLVLNQTNCNAIIEAYGPESQMWVGRQIQLYPTRVQFGANMVPAIRVQVPQAAPAAPGCPPQGQPGFAPPGAPQYPQQAAPPPALAQGVQPTYQPPQYAPQQGGVVPAPGGFGAPAPAPAAVPPGAPFPGANPLG